LLSKLLKHYQIKGLDIKMTTDFNYVFVEIILLNQEAFHAFGRDCLNHGIIYYTYYRCEQDFDYASDMLCGSIGFLVDMTEEFIICKNDISIKEKAIILDSFLIKGIDDLMYRQGMSIIHWMRRVKHRSVDGSISYSDFSDISKLSNTKIFSEDAYSKALMIKEALIWNIRPHKLAVTFLEKPPQELSPTTIFAKNCMQFATMAIRALGNKKTLGEQLRGFTFTVNCFKFSSFNKLYEILKRSEWVEGKIYDHYLGNSKETVNIRGDRVFSDRCGSTTNLRFRIRVPDNAGLEFSPRSRSYDPLRACFGNYWNMAPAIHLVKKSQIQRQGQSMYRLGKEMLFTYDLNYEQLTFWSQFEATVENLYTEPIRINDPCIGKVFKDPENGHIFEVIDLVMKRESGDSCSIYQRKRPRVELVEVAYYWCYLLSICRIVGECGLRYEPEAERRLVQSSTTDTKRGRFYKVELVRDIKQVETLDSFSLSGRNRIKPYFWRDSATENIMNQDNLGSPPLYKAARWVAWNFLNSVNSTRFINQGVLLCDLQSNLECSYSKNQILECCSIFEVTKPANTNQGKNIIAHAVADAILKRVFDAISYQTSYVSS
jgi:hypothetical protein